jgi:hypothetical protein
MCHINLVPFKTELQECIFLTLKNIMKLIQFSEKFELGPFENAATK